MGRGLLTAVMTVLVALTAPVALAQEENAPPGQSQRPEKTPKPAPEPEPEPTPAPAEPTPAPADDEPDGAAAGPAPGEPPAPAPDPGPPAATDAPAPSPATGPVDPAPAVRTLGVRGSSRDERERSAVAPLVRRAPRSAGETGPAGAPVPATPVEAAADLAASIATLALSPAAATTRTAGSPAARPAATPDAAAPSGERPEARAARDLFGVVGRSDLAALLLACAAAAGVALVGVAASRGYRRFVA